MEKIFAIHVIWLIFLILSMGLQTVVAQIAQPQAKATPVPVAKPRPTTPATKVAPPATKPAPTPLAMNPETNPGVLKFNVKGLLDAGTRLDAPLEPWSLPAEMENVDDKNTQSWKAQKAGGPIEYMDKAPDPEAGYEKIWCVFKSPVEIYTQYVGLGTVNSTPRPVWGRMYWNPKNKTWGASHPNLLAFKDEESRAEWILENAALTYGGPGVSSAMRKPWYALININAGAAQTPEQKQKILKENTDTLQKLDLWFGAQTGLGDAFWNARRLSIASNERISPTITPEQRIQFAEQRRAYLKTIVNTLCNQP